MDVEDPPNSSSNLLSVQPIRPSPDVLTKLVNRLRALTLTLLPLEVDRKTLNDPTSWIITPNVIEAYLTAAGDFAEALPYCLLRARAEFIWDMNHNPADYGENYGRAIACEVLARRIVRQASPDRLASIMSTRFKHRQLDGDESEMSSALEMAIDANCTIFLSSTEAQYIVNALWNGELVQKNIKHNDVDYVQHFGSRDGSFWASFEPARLAVPRYQNIFRIVVWLFFLVVYSQAVREPLDRLDENHMDLEEWEIVLYFMSLSFFIEDTYKFIKLLRFVTWRAFSFWNIVAFLTDSLLLSAFVIRLVGLASSGDYQATMRLRSFQVLSFVAPLIWMKLVTIFDGYKYIGTMQICVSRMLRESGIFFALISILALGFGQGLYALDAADGEAEQVSSLLNVLIQALLQAPNYSRFEGSLWLYYCWNLVTAVILLNILISLFSSAYSEVVDNAEAQYLAFFAAKTVGMIRAPDSFVYPAPFNLVETFFVAPFEIIPVFSLNSDNYAKLNRYVMTIVFFVPLTLIALFESTFRPRNNKWMARWLSGEDEGEVDGPMARDPTISDGDGLEISKVPFSELIKSFPNTTESTEATLVKEVQGLKGQMEEVLKKLDSLQTR